MSAIPAKSTRSGVSNTLYKLPIPWKKVFTYFFAVLAFFYIVGPFAWIVISSFMTPEETISVPPHWITQNPTLDNYSAYWDAAVVNSMREERRTTIGGVVTAVPIALRNSIAVAFT